MQVLPARFEKPNGPSSSISFEIPCGFESGFSFGNYNWVWVQVFRYPYRTRFVESPTHNPKSYAKLNQNHTVSTFLNNAIATHNLNY